MTKVVEDNKYRDTFSLPISPPFVFRDPTNPSIIFGVAYTIEKLIDILPLIPFSSIENHVHKLSFDEKPICDLGTWIKLVIGNDELAKEIENLGTDYKGLKLKEQLLGLLKAFVNL